MIIDEVSCCGCMACYVACTQAAIEVRHNAEGFLQPHININKCVLCGACLQTCPEQNPVGLHSGNDYRAVIAKQRIPGSSTVGVFGSIARAFAQKENHYVCGCILDDEQTAEHVLTNDPMVIARMSGSKYVQSDNRKALQQILEVMRHGGFVLYGGVPCQCAAVLKYCERYGDRLYIIDLFCRGVGSPKLWKNYLKQTTVDIESCTFRPQDGHEPVNWHLLIKEKGRNAKLRFAETDPYLTLYYHGLINRRSCYSCIYQDRNRCGDLSLGDCASYKDLIPHIKEAAVGVTACNTEKGETLLEMIKEDFIFYKIDSNKEVRLNTGFCLRDTFPFAREKIGRVMLQLPIRELQHRYIKPDIKSMLRLVIHRTTSPQMRRRILDIRKRRR